MKKEIIKERIKKNWEITYKNKLTAIGVMTLGGVSVLIDGDATLLVVTLLMGIPLFLATTDCIY